jgi:hypothetical protein
VGSPCPGGQRASRNRRYGYPKLAQTCLRKRGPGAAYVATPRYRSCHLGHAHRQRGRHAPGFFGIGAKHGDIAYLSKPADWKLQITTPNSSSLYVYFNFNLKDGPIVLEFKPWVAFFRFYGPEPAIQNKTWVLNNIEETR